MSAPKDLRIVGAQVLLERGLAGTPVRVSGADGVISEIGADRNSARVIDARGLFLLPGIVDIHGDAFERQIMPRPGVHVDLDIGLMGQRPAGRRQRHHHRVPQRDVVVGARLAWLGQCTRDSRRDRSDEAATFGRYALPPAPRDVQSRGRG
jgi:cytosine/adenosine deaminase-related metal-dependent hydrolase